MKSFFRFIPFLSANPAFSGRQCIFREMHSILNSVVVHDETVLGGIEDRYGV